MHWEWRARTAAILGNSIRAVTRRSGLVSMFPWWWPLYRPAGPLATRTSAFGETGPASSVTHGRMAPVMLMPQFR